ncbi:hypothetical protein RvY_07043 [Ramazzottius varieornatus]|uniref:UBC core domain-containing protein n=1 Tax=Ramazzottius varieornatus TaxID=947166 RepID=A0A1D1V0P6_RAMVA|nr:hypothetical protein RvY_07043 [Ramazzottius varieornatus]
MDAMESQYNSRNPAVKRLFREAQELRENPDEDFHAAPLEDNLFEWHFTIRGPAETAFENGLYHGRIVLPADYPMKPPNIIILTPNGRFETNTKICLSISGYHPETWQPSWSIRTALKALIGFMPTPGNGAIGSQDLSDDRRKALALTSRSWTCPECKQSNSEILKISPVQNLTTVVKDASAEQIAVEIPATITDSTTGTQTNPTATVVEEVPSGDRSIAVSPPVPKPSPESASGNGDGEDVTFSPLPPRPRTSSLQSRPGRGIGKKAHFQDELPQNQPSTTPGIPSPTPSSNQESYSFPPHTDSGRDSRVQSQLSVSTSSPPSTPEKLSLSTPTATTSRPSSSPSFSATDAMKERQNKILEERKKLLQRRLAATQPEVEASQPVPPVAAAAAPSGLARNSTTNTAPARAASSMDMARLERSILMLRQTVILILLCIFFLVIRRIFLVLDEDDYDLEDLKDL